MRNYAEYDFVKKAYSLKNAAARLNIVIPADTGKPYALYDEWIR